MNEESDPMLQAAVFDEDGVCHIIAIPGYPAPPIGPTEDHGESEVLSAGPAREILEHVGFRDRRF